MPARLLDLADPPERLYLHGELPRGPAVAIVGTRKATRPARRFARQLAAELSSAGVTILSGGALGIDSEAHRGALHAGGPTVVVAPAGFERPYPPENAPLFESILAAGGAYLSARAPTEAADLGTFFPRNAVLVALAHALVVVEAPVRSGARNAAQCARRLGRPLLVVPSAPWNLRGRGCIVELRLGARVLGSSRDVLGALAEQRLHPIALGSRRSRHGDRATTAASGRAVRGHGRGARAPGGDGCGAGGSHRHRRAQRQPRHAGTSGPAQRPHANAAGRGHDGRGGSDPVGRAEMTERPLDRSGLIRAGTGYQTRWTCISLLLRTLAPRPPALPSVGRRSARL